MSVRFRRCTHTNFNGGSAIKVTQEWRDSAGFLWLDEECRNCGRIWRSRVIPFLRSLRSAA